jgi:hypothetical protein
MLRVIRLESKKEQGNLELTGAELTDLTILDNFGDNKFTLKVLNLWENSLTNIDSLAHFTGLQELYLNENRVTSIHGIARLEHLIQLSFQNNELCGDLPVFNFHIFDTWIYPSTNSPICTPSQNPSYPACRTWTSEPTTSYNCHSCTAKNYKPTTTHTTA